MEVEAEVEVEALMEAETEVETGVEEEEVGKRTKRSSIESRKDVVRIYSRSVVSYEGEQEVWF